MKLSFLPKKATSAFFILAILSQAFAFTLFPQKAQATVVEDVLGFPTTLGGWVQSIYNLAKSTITAENSVISAVKNTITSVETTISAEANAWFTWVKTLSLDAVVWNLKQMLIAKLMGMMIQYIQTGFNGGPSFITNRNAYYQGISNGATQVFLSEMDHLRAMTDPVSLTDRILNETQANLEQKAYQDYRTAITPIAGSEFPGGKKGYDAFTQRFNSCQTGNGWNCWISSLNKTNDPWEVYKTQLTELEKQRNEAIRHATDEVNAANGFATVKTCVQMVVRNQAEHCAQYLATIPGKIIVDQLSKYQAAALDELHQADTINEFVAAAIVDLGTSWMGNSSFLSTVNVSKGINQAQQYTPGGSKFVGPLPE